MFEEVLMRASSIAETGADKCFGFTRAMAESILGFVAASDLERKCIYAVASKTMVTDLEDFREAFAFMDRDRDGRLLRKDLAQTLVAVNRRFSVTLNADTIFRAVDIHCLGTIDFLHFAAACLHTQLSPLDTWLAKQSFDCLDADEDGFIRPDDVLSVFGELPRGLPTSQPIGYNVWQRAVCESGASCSRRDRASPKAQHASAALLPLDASFVAESFLGMFFSGCKTSGAVDQHTEMVLPRKQAPTQQLWCTSGSTELTEPGLDHPYGGNGSPMGRSRSAAAAAQALVGMPSLVFPPRSPTYGRCGSESMNVFKSLSSPTYVPLSAR